MRNFLLYGLASGFNRGGMFLILPLLSSLLTIVDFGRFSIYIIAVQLLVPLVSLNIVSIIGREIFEKFKITVFFTVFFNRIAFLVITLCAACYLFLHSVFFLITIYAFSEAVFLLISTFVRFKRSAKDYFYLCVGKMLLLIAILLMFYLFDSSVISKIDPLIIIFSLSNLVAAPFFSGLSFGLKIKSKTLFSKIRKEQAILFFAIGFLPHTLAQWVTSGSDRFFVKYISGDLQLGYYSYGYAIAAVYMVVNSALALGVPQYCVQKFDLFSARKFFIQYFSVVTLLWGVFLSVIGIGLFTIHGKYDPKEIFLVVYFVLSGMYFLSFYYYYSSFLFYARMSKELSAITVGIAISNVIFVVILTPLFGIAGAAFGTTLSYFLYTHVTYIYAAKKFQVEGVLLPVCVFVLSAISIFMVNICAGFFY